MTALGHERFQVASHDRGARVAHRLALDAPERVQRLAVLDIVPTIEHFERTDMAFALGYYHWFWFAQPHPKPESIINAAPDAWFDAHTSRDGEHDFFDPEALADYLRGRARPRDHRRHVRGLPRRRQHRPGARPAEPPRGRRVQCPLLVLWGEKGRIGGWYDPLTLWREYCDGPVSGGPVPSGHYLAEEAPADVLRWLEPFLEA